MTAKGCDYAYGRPSVAALKAAGISFVCRYVSSPGNAKNITKAEADTLRAGGITVVIVWEGGAQSMMGGRMLGITAAQEAVREAKAAGMPNTAAIYFAADFDVQLGQVPTILAFLAGARSVWPRVGCYGGYTPIHGALDAGYMGWQTFAWSGGRWDPRAHIRQLPGQPKIGGVTVDIDEGYGADFGQWDYQGGDMTEEELAKAAGFPSFADLAIALRAAKGFSLVAHGNQDVPANADVKAGSELAKKIGTGGPGGPVPPGTEFTAVTK